MREGELRTRPEPTVWASAPPVFSSPPPSPPSPAGSLDLALINAGNADGASSPYAKCFGALTVVVDASCALTVSGTSSTGVYLNTLYTPSGVTLSYNDYVAW
jgi:hypothetical protein